MSATTSAATLPQTEASARNGQNRAALERLLHDRLRKFMSLLPKVLAEDSVGTNPAVRFSVETFEATEGFQPSKPYRSRLLWRDLEGNTQSKLLLSAPEAVLAIAVKGEAPAASRRRAAS